MGVVVVVVWVVVAGYDCLYPLELLTPSLEGDVDGEDDDDVVDDGEDDARLELELCRDAFDGGGGGGGGLFDLAIVEGAGKE